MAASPSTRAHTQQGMLVTLTYLEPGTGHWVADQLIISTTLLLTHHHLVGPLHTPAAQLRPGGCAGADLPGVALPVSEPCRAVVDPQVRSQHRVCTQYWPSMFDSTASDIDEHAYTSFTNTA
jgi:hypothetical protein